MSLSSFEEVWVKDFHCRLSLKRNLNSWPYCFISKRKNQKVVEGVRLYLSKVSSEERDPIDSRAYFNERWVYGIHAILHNERSWLKLNWELNLIESDNSLQWLIENILIKFMWSSIHKFNCEALIIKSFMGPTFLNWTEAPLHVLTSGTLKLKSENRYWFTLKDQFDSSDHQYWWMKLWVDNFRFWFSIPFLRDEIQIWINISTFRSLSIIILQIV
jgi:hypothetical protein